MLFRSLQYHSRFYSSNIAPHSPTLQQWVRSQSAAKAMARPRCAVEPPAAAAPVIDDTTVAWPRTVDGSVQTMVASVGGQGIPLTDLVSKWVLRDPDGVRAILDDLLLSRIVTFEAAALDVRLPDGAIADEVARRMAALETAAREVGCASVGRVADLFAEPIRVYCFAQATPVCATFRQGGNDLIFKFSI